MFFVVVQCNVMKQKIGEGTYLKNKTQCVIGSLVNKLSWPGGSLNMKHSSL